jgi:hypothetical protein
MWVPVGEQLASGEFIEIGSPEICSSRTWIAFQIGYSVPKSA